MNLNKGSINQLHKQWDSAQFERDSEALERKITIFLRIIGIILCVGLVMLVYCCNKFEWLG